MEAFKTTQLEIVSSTFFNDLGILHDSWQLNFGICEEVAQKGRIVKNLIYVNVYFPKQRVHTDGFLRKV